MPRIVIELNGTTLTAGIAALAGVGVVFWMVFGTQPHRIPTEAPLLAAASPAAAPEEPTPSSTLPNVSPARARWHLSFADEFDKTRLDSSKWIDSYPHGVRTHANNEKEYYDSANHPVHDGFLHLIGQRKEQSGMPYTSGMIASYGKFQQRYGRFEMRAKFPRGRGFWPAFWLLPAGNNWPPEIDILEILAHEPHRIYFSNHWRTQQNHEHVTMPWNGPDFSADFHTFALEWSPDVMIWSVDGVERFRQTNHIPDEPMYVLVNLAVGGDWPGLPDQNTRFPGEMIVDYVRVYQR